MQQHARFFSSIVGLNDTIQIPFSWRACSSFSFIPVWWKWRRLDFVRIVLEYWRRLVMFLEYWIVLVLISPIFTSKSIPVIKPVVKPSASASSYRAPIANITPDMPDEQRLFYTLMTGYEKAVRPTKKASEAVVVKLGITLTQIMDIVSDHSTKVEAVWWRFSPLGWTKSNHDYQYLVGSGKMQMK